ncbi:DgyrCDS5931 [Dimorphilus gyrociliatus]|uniref:DgyrCDS5931 n=1 Tax=Dimorphilus gyrociliatus TaxID=2664684 RepID=A0A7I8VLK2_9ANNE|nr:DgyrCDS5931 [Dimorphilus gyrociliatus]
MACGATLKRSLEFDPLHSPARSPKRRRCTPMTLSPNIPPTKQHQTTVSPFLACAPRLSHEQIYANLHAEIRRMRARRQLSPTHSTICIGETSPGSATGLSSPCKQDKPLFTFKQVSLFCEKMLKEHEAELREEYDKVLVTKMAEQYEAFLKFNHDQLRQRFNDAATASYVS